jgi:CheY-like chemotaxis protein
VPLQLLVVEDDAPVLAHALRTVAGLGWQALAARSGAEAMALLAAGRPCDLLLTDVTMPGMTGGQLAEAARRLRPGLAVVFVTGHSADPAVARLRRAPGVVVLSKPYRRATLAEAIRRALAQAAGQGPPAG